MTDIHDIKNILEIFPLNGYSILYLIAIWLLILIVYFVKKKKKSELKTTLKPQIKEVFDPQVYLKKLEKLEEKMRELDAKQFYSQLNQIFLEYLEKVWYHKISKMSLEEIRLKFLKKELVNLLQKTYYYGFDPGVEDSVKTRKSNLKEIKEAIRHKSL